MEETEEGHIIIKKEDREHLLLTYKEFVLFLALLSGSFSYIGFGIALFYHKHINEVLDMNTTTLINSYFASMTAGFFLFSLLSIMLHKDRIIKIIGRNDGTATE